MDFEEKLQNEVVTEVMPIIEMPKTKVYILLDKANRLIRIEDETLLPIEHENWLLIDEGYGDKYNLAQTHYLDKPLINVDMTHNYKYVEGEIVECSDDEKAEERATFPPTPPTNEERIADLEDTIASLDEMAIELYEANEVEKEINEAQDEALIEIYDMLME